MANESNVLYLYCNISTIDGGGGRKIVEDRFSAGTGGGARTGAGIGGDGEGVSTCPENPGIGEGGSIGGGPGRDSGV